VDVAGEFVALSYGEYGSAWKNVGESSWVLPSCSLKKPHLSI
jgi:hypothetical protein